MDNHGSHLTWDFLNYYETNNILVLAFPPYTTHFLQPLDGKPFQQYKHYYGKAVNKAARYGAPDFQKREFLEALPGIRTKAFKTRTVQSGFSDRGIWPYDPAPILKALEKRVVPIPDIRMEISGSTPSPEPSIPLS